MKTSRFKPPVWKCCVLSTDFCNILTRPHQVETFQKLDDHDIRVWKSMSKKTKTPSYRFIKIFLTAAPEKYLNIWKLVTPQLNITHWRESPQLNIPSHWKESANFRNYLSCLLDELDIWYFILCIGLIFNRSDQWPKWVWVVCKETHSA